MEKGCICQRCGYPYKVDFMVPDELWERIRNYRNLLCGVCIAVAIEKLDKFDSFTLVQN